jgi:pyruvate kinase
MELDSIILASDAIMIARGDLGVEIPSHEVPLWQKRIIKKCNQAGRCVITATQMLESMVMNPRPTRAESSDVANAVLDGTDVVMLSAETSVGAYPIESVRTMNDIIESAESIMLYGQSIKHPPSIQNEDERSEYAIASAACELSEQVGAKAILCFTYRGVTAKMMSRQRPDIPIIAITQNEKICRMLMLYNGVEALALKEQPVSTDDAIVLMKKTAFENGYVKKGDRVILTAGYPVVTKARTNMMVIDVI